ncbi:hypothetical protein C8J56DRAFT_1076117 [Mycena floridula]|nr:hypothetical protein C8J56DRAFT_1076117 [Mycena floridula]
MIGTKYHQDLLNSSLKAQDADEYRGDGQREREDLFWVNLHPFLKREGYELRPRFRPGWKPSWLPGGRLAGMEYWDCEDSLGLDIYWAALDAIQIKDGKKVVLKIIFDDTEELKVSLMFSQPPLRDDPANHCVQVLKVLTISDSERRFKILVLPLLLDFSVTSVHCVSEVIDFMRQTLELESSYSFRDISEKNIMMQASKVVPLGCHFSSSSERALPSGRLVPCKIRQHRCRVPVRYLFIDFGLSKEYPEGQKHARSVARVGQVKVTPEMSKDGPYNPFKADIVQLGTVFKKMFFSESVFDIHEFDVLLEGMTLGDAEARPTAVEALLQFKSIVNTMSDTRLRTRLRDKFWRPSRIRCFAERHLPSSCSRSLQVLAKYASLRIPRGLVANVPGSRAMGLGLYWAALDAIQVEDGKKVVLKIVFDDTHELSVSNFFSEPRLRDDPHNHCVRVHKVIPFPNRRFQILVLPFLIDCNIPRVHCMPEIIDFIRQMLQGLEFMHDKNIAHGKRSTDVDPLQSGISSSNFGLSRHYPEGKESARVLGKFGQVEITPEMSDDVPWSPFKADILQLGNVFRKMFLLDPHFNIHDFDLLFDAMTTNPEDRPTATEALSQFENIVSSMSTPRLTALNVIQHPINSMSLTGVKIECNNTGFAESPDLESACSAGHYYVRLMRTLRRVTAECVKIPTISGSRTSSIHTYVYDQGVHVPVRLSFTPSAITSNFRIQVYLNGWQIGKYVNNIGPQTVFVLPAGILTRNRPNTVALSLWLLDAAGASIA